MEWQAHGGSNKNLQNLSGAASGEGPRDNYRLVKEMTDNLLKDNAFVTG